MAKDLPYFRFTASEWQNGDISLERLELKGLFIDICAYYWVKNCCVDMETLKKKFNQSKGLIDELIALDILKSKRDNIEIPFLDSQIKELLDLSEKRKSAGAKGGKKYSRWSPIERKRGNQLYVILFYNKKESFIKIGTTTTCIADRYSVPNDYDSTTIYQYFSNKVVDIELELHKKLSSFSYIPKNKFGGHTECFSLNCANNLAQLVENKNFETINNLKQTISKIEANQNQTTSYKDKDNNKDNILSISEIVLFLNQSTGKKFKETGDAIKKIISARLADYTVDDLKKVIDIKTSQWKNTDMEKYLRPETLFNATKFEGYLNETPKKEVKPIVRIEASAIFPEANK